MDSSYTDRPRLFTAWASSAVAMRGKNHDGLFFVITSLVHDSSRIKLNNLRTAPVPTSFLFSSPKTSTAASHKPVLFILSLRPGYGFKPYRVENASLQPIYLASQLQYVKEQKHKHFAHARTLYHFLNQKTSYIFLSRFSNLFLYACATVGLAIESANIVGYSAVNDGGNNNPGIGSVFMPINEGGTYKLSSITVSGASEGEYMDPESEYLQMLNPNGSAVTHRYTYVSKEFLIDCFGEEESKEFEDAIGWWNWSEDIVSYIEDSDFSNKCEGLKDPDIDVGTAFLGLLLGNNLKFTSSGSVPTESTAFCDNGNNNPFFMNYLPVEIDLTDVTVSGASEGEYMDPESEYLQVLNPNGSAVTHRYTYVSEEFLVDAFGEEEAKSFAGAIGWWNWDEDIVAYIEDADYTKKINVGDVPLAPGFSFLGLLLGNSLDFNFPAATK